MMPDEAGALQPISPNTAQLLLQTVYERPSSPVVQRDFMGLFEIVLERFFERAPQGSADDHCARLVVVNETAHVEISGADRGHDAIDDGCFRV